MRKRNLPALAAAVVAIGGLSKMAQSQTTFIYQDNFTAGSSGTPVLINGQTPTVDTTSATWVSSTNAASGSIPDADISENGANAFATSPTNPATAEDADLITNAWLPFTPQTGFLYDLELKIDVVTVATGGHWTDFGFQQAAPSTFNGHLGPVVNGVTYPDVGDGSAAMTNLGPVGLIITKDTNTAQFFEGVGTGNGSVSPTFTTSQYNTFDILLNTSGSIWLVTQELNGTVETTYTFANATSNPTLGFVGFGTNKVSANYSDFSLSETPVAPPPPPTPTWSAIGSGDWNNSNNWSGAIPNGVGTAAQFFSAITAPSVVYTNQAETLSTLHFNSSNTYELSGTGNLTIQSPAGTGALVQVDTGTAIDDLPTTIASSTTLKVATGASLTFGNPVLINGGISVAQSTAAVGTTTYTGSVNYQSKVTVGSGSTLTLASATNGNNLTLQGSSQATIAPSSGTAQFMSLNINSGSHLDLTNNELLINYGPTGSDPVAAVPSSQIFTYLADGFKSGWSGGEIMSSTVANLDKSGGHVYAVGYIDGAQPPVNYSGTVPPSGTIEIVPTISGDATLSGTVNFYDFQDVLSNFGKASAAWDQGDFDYTGTVDFYDFQVVLSNFGQNSSALSAGELATLNNFAEANDNSMVVSTGSGLSLVSVPEPASLMMLAGVGGIALLGRRRNNKRRSGKSSPSRAGASPGSVAIPVAASLLALGGLASASHAQTTIFSDSLTDGSGPPTTLAGTPGDTVPNGNTWISFYDNNDAVVAPATQSISTPATTAWPTTPTAGTTAGYSGTAPFVPTRYDTNDNPSENINSGFYFGTQFGSTDTHVDDGAYIGIPSIGAGLLTVDTNVMLTSNSTTDGTAWGAVGLLADEPNSLTTSVPDFVDQDADVGPWILIRPNLGGSGNGDYAELYATGGTAHEAGNLQFIPDSPLDGDGDFWGLEHSVEIDYSPSGGGTLQAYIDGVQVLNSPYSYSANGVAAPNADGIVIGDRTNSPGSSGGNTTGVSPTDPSDVYFNDLTASFTAPPPNSNWLPAAGGNFNTSANWDNGTPNGVGETATIATIGSNSTIYTNTAVTLSGLHSNNSSELEITGLGSLTMQAVAGSNAFVQVDQNTLILNLPVTLASSTLFNLDGGNLVIANPLTVDAGVTLSTSGSGTVTYESLITLGAHSSFLLDSSGSIQLGTLDMPSDSHVAVAGSVNRVTVNQLSLGGGSSIDVGNGPLSIDYGAGADPIGAVQGYLASGYNGGAWNGPGINSSYVAAHPSYGLGFVDASGAILIEPALLGDASLSGSVGYSDFAALAACLGQPGQWDQGNFLYQPTVDTADFNALAGNISVTSLTGGELATIESFGASLGEGLTPNSSGVGFSISAVPEPASMSVLVLGGFGLLSRRRRKSETVA